MMGDMSEGRGACMVRGCTWQEVCMAGGMYDGGHEWGKRDVHGEGGVPGKRCAWQEWHACRKDGH